MCVGPGALAIVSALTSVAGTAVSAYGSYQAGQAQAAQSERNAVIAQRNAADSRARGQVAEADQRLKTQQLRAKQINVLSERNIDLRSGSALDILGDSAAFGEMDALSIRNNFDREAVAYETQASNFSMESDQQKKAARFGLFGSGIKLANTALGGYTDYKAVKAKQQMGF